MEHRAWSIEYGVWSIAENGNSRPDFQIPGHSDTCVGYYCIFRTKKMDGKKRANIRIGSHVEIVQKMDQRTGELTEGYVEKILTSSPTHPHGIKVRLETGEVGRVQHILEDE